MADAQTKNNMAICNGREGVALKKSQPPVRGEGRKGPMQGIYNAQSLGPPHAQMRNKTQETGEPGSGGRFANDRRETRTAISKGSGREAIQHSRLRMKTKQGAKNRPVERRQGWNIATRQA